MKTLISISVLAALAWFAFGDRLPAFNKHGSNISQPSIEWQNATQSLTAFRLSKDDAFKVSAFYEAVSIVLKNDDGRIIANVSDFRNAYTSIGNGCFGKELLTKYPGLSDSIDSVLSMAVSLQTTELNGENRKRLSDACHAIAWRFSNQNGVIYGF